MRHKSRTVFFLAVASSITGCAVWKAPHATGPRFSLGKIEGAASEKLISFEIDDARPRWERNYYSGSMNPLSYQWAISFVPMENFQPDFNKHVRSELTAVCETFRKHPENFSVKLDSFRLVYNEVDMQKDFFEQIDEERDLIREEKHTQKLKEREEVILQEQHRKLMHSDYYRSQRDDDKADQRNEDSSIGAQILGEFLGLCLQGFFQAMIEGLSGSGFDTPDWPLTLRNGKKLAVKPPHEIRKEDYAPGMTCEINAMVTIRWKDGTVIEESVKGRSYTGRPLINAELNNEDISETVRSAIRTLGNDLSRQTVAIQKTSLRK